MTEYARIVNGVIASRRPEPTGVEQHAGRDWDFRELRRDRLSRAHPQTP